MARSVSFGRTLQLGRLCVGDDTEQLCGGAQVVGSTIVGRSIALLGQAPAGRDGSTAPWLAGCDVLLHPAAPAACQQEGYGGAAKAGSFASTAAAKHLVLTGALPCLAVWACNHRMQRFCCPCA